MIGNVEIKHVHVTIPIGASVSLKELMMAVKVNFG